MPNKKAVTLSLELFGQACFAVNFKKFTVPLSTPESMSLLGVNSLIFVSDFDIFLT